MLFLIKSPLSGSHGNRPFPSGNASCKDSRNRDAKRLTASSRLEAWVRCFCETTLRTPDLLSRVGSWFLTICFCRSERPGELSTSNQSVTLVLTLFTFCPPGPLLREAVNVNSLKGIESRSVIFFYHCS